MPHVHFEVTGPDAVVCLYFPDSLRRSKRKSMRTPTLQAFDAQNAMAKGKKAVHMAATQ